jgi:glucose/arabinose dehydrogenase
MTRRAGLGVVALACCAIAIGCGDGGSATTTETRATTTSSKPAADGNGGVKLEKVGDFDQPVYVTAAPGDDRDLFVVQQTGKVVDVRLGHPNVDQGVPFLDLSNEVSCCGEQGLLSIAFPRDYVKSHLVYADYTDKAGDTQVVEYRTSGNPAVAVPGSARTVATVNQPFANHNGGQLQFGPDGRLYIGLGDGGSEGDPNRVGQDPSSPLAKILVIDPTDRNAKPQTFAMGLRNPWRFSFDSKTGDLWIGDVGQDHFEEVDGLAFKQADGANFGWSAMEGNERFNEDQKAPGAIPPVLTYPHSDGCSVTGGYVVRDRTLPTLYGRYLYGDFCAGDLRSFTARPGTPATDDRPLGIQVPSLSSFGEDSSGHIYATSLEGPVYRLVPSS